MGQAENGFIGISCSGSPSFLYVKWQCGGKASKRLLQHNQETNPYDTSDTLEGDKAVQPLVSSRPEQASIVPCTDNLSLPPLPIQAENPSSSRRATVGTSTKFVSRQS